MADESSQGVYQQLREAIMRPHRQRWQADQERADRLLLDLNEVRQALEVARKVNPDPAVSYLVDAVSRLTTVVQELAPPSGPEPR